MKQREYKYDIGQTINDLIITNRGRKPNCHGWSNKYYQYKCSKCGFDCGEYYKNGELYNEFWITEGNLNAGNRCACCSGKITVSGINDINTTDKWMIDFLVNKNDAFKYSTQSNRKIDMRCTLCGTIHHNKIIGNLYKYKRIACPCSGGASYAEKFIMSLLQQTKYEFSYQVSKYDNWFIEKDIGYRYDFGIKALNMIIETHGEQHYVSREFYGVNNFEAIQENDKKKFEYAKLKGIVNYIILDCRKSNLEFIKQSILNTELLKLLDIDEMDVNWEKHASFAEKPLTYEINDYKNKNPLLSNIEVGKHFGLDNSSIGRYLKQAEKIGLSTNYKKYNAIRQSVHKKIRKKIVVLDINKNYIKTYESVQFILDAQESELGTTKLTRPGIYGCCNHRTKTHWNYIFIYEDEYNAKLLEG